MKNAYPTFIAQKDDCFLVFVPDMEIYTEGTSFLNAIEMAREAIALKGIELENNNSPIPEPSDTDSAFAAAYADADSVFDYSQGTLTYVDVDFSSYRRKFENKMVRRNVTIPVWLDYEAKKANLNVSKFLQEALKEKFS